MISKETNCLAQRLDQLDDGHPLAQILVSYYYVGMEELLMALTPTLRFVN